MDKQPIPDQAEIEAIAGHRFPGGSYTIAHWENFLLTQCTGAELLPAGMAHPIALFHLPIIGSGTSIAEMFALGRAESDLSIVIESYDWQYFQPLKEDTRYSVQGEITSSRRCRDNDDNIYDRIQFRFDISDPDNNLAARTTVTWHYTRDTL